MNIGIDARLISETGVGRYIQNLVQELGDIDTENRYVLFLRKKNWEGFRLPNDRWEKRLADVPWHSVAEQIFMPYIFGREHLDLVHIPYFNVPVFYFGKFIVTIHDLTILHFDTGKASTLPWVLYKLRRLGYFLALSAAVHRAQKIIAVSQTTKKEITDHFDVLERDIVVTYEGIDEKLVRMKGAKRPVADPYFLYVGNAYPHKNLETLVGAFAKLKGDAKLIFVGKDDFFYRRLKAHPIVGQLGARVQFVHGATDRTLAGLYRHAEALVFPSYMEGFGLPALEALAFGCPVIASDISVFHELLDGAAEFFNPHDIQALAGCLTEALAHPKRAALKKKAPTISGKFSWRTMAKDTLSVYASV